MVFGSFQGFGIRLPDGFLTDVAVAVDFVAADFAPGGDVDGQIAGQGGIGFVNQLTILVAAIIAPGVAVAGRTKGMRTV